MLSQLPTVPALSPAHFFGDVRDRHLRHGCVSSLPRVPTAAVADRAAEVEVDCIAASRVDGEDRVAQRDAQLLLTIHWTLREEDLQLQSSSLAFPYVCPEPASVKSSFAQFTMRL